MLKNLDLSKKVSKSDYNATMEALGLRLGAAQRAAREAKKPIIIVFEGWRGAHRSAIINEMMQCLDSRDFTVHTTSWVDEITQKQPFFTYFWQHLPALNQIAVYHRSWYYKKEILDEKADQDDKVKRMTYNHINTFEKELTDDNYLILKYFLHISKEKQLENKEENNKHFGSSWGSVHPALDDGKDYDKYFKYYDEMLEETDTNNAPWHVVSAENLRNAKLTIYTSIVETIEKVLAAEKVEPHTVRPVAQYDVLSRVNPYQEMSKEEYKKTLDKYQKKLAQLQIEMFQAGISTVIGFEGWDAGGKGGAIRRLTSALDPLAYIVHPVAAPNVVERQFHYLWRFWRYLPNPGTTTIFDRTWYGRVMVERLEGFAKPYEWQRAYDEMKDMEQQWTEHGMVVVKFWLQIDKDEQLRRFTERQNNPEKQWKITDEDWRNREKWDVYEEAVNEMIARTDTSYAPWVIVEGNNKYYARLKVMKTIIDLWEEKLGKNKKADK